MANNLTGVDYLGCIYDIYGYYARANSVNTAKRIFNLPDADTQITIQGEEYSYPKDAVGAPALLYESDEKISSYESTEDLYTEMSVSANLSGSYGLFSSEVDAKYNSSYTSSNYYYHVEKSGYVNSYKLTLDLNYALKNLDEDFYNDLYNYNEDDEKYEMSADDLVAKYGTHFLYEAIFGGRWSYSQSISKLNYSSSEDVESRVQANYESYSADISASSETDESESINESNGEFWCIGGTPETLTEGFEAWSATISSNFVLVDFTSDSLKRISELVVDELVVDNTDRRGDIDTAINAVLNAGQNPSTTYLTTTSDNQKEWSEGDDKYLDEKSGAKNDGYAVVGFGGLIKDNEFIRIALCYLDLSTGKRQWEVFGDRTSFNQDDYETLGEVPEGCVVTGIGLKGNGKKFTKMVLYYQQLMPVSPTYNYLDTTVNSIAFQGKKEKSPDGSYEVEFKPNGYDGMVITGIDVGYRGKTEKVKYLKLYRNKLEEIVVEGATATKDNTGQQDATAA